MRRTVIFHGTVQGVGFRYTTYQLAKDFAVTGYVRNCRDGSVELVAEGTPGEIGRFLEAIRRRMGENIDREDVSDSQATGEFSEFYVR